MMILVVIGVFTIKEKRTITGGFRFPETLVLG